MKNGKVVAEEPLLTDLKTRIRDVRVGPDGAVYVLTEQKALLKLTPN
jgi:glucose/arabinose dehydrogenase